jgi:hypothetical protein
MPLRKGQKHKGSFKPGNKGGPGKPKLPEEIRLIATHTKQDIIDAYFRLSRLTPAQAGKYKAKTVLEMGILKCFHDFTRTGRTDQMRHLWAECHGKPKESVELNIPNIPVSIYINGIAPTTDTADSN